MKMLRTMIFLLILTVAMAMIGVGTANAKGGKVIRDRFIHDHPAITVLSSLPCENGSGRTFDAYLRDTLSRTHEFDQLMMSGVVRRVTETIQNFSYNLVSGTPATAVVDVTWTAWKEPGVGKVGGRRFWQRYTVDVEHSRVSPMPVKMAAGEGNFSFDRAFDPTPEAIRRVQGSFERFGEWCELEKASPSYAYSS